MQIDRIKDIFAAWHGDFDVTLTRRDLAAALRATLDGKPVAQTGTPAVGCILSDFLR